MTEKVMAKEHCLYSLHSIQQDSYMVEETLTRDPDVNRKEQ